MRTVLPLPAVVNWDPAKRARQRIARALRLAETPLATSSMQLGGLVLLDLLRREGAELPMVFVDTGYLHPETIEFRDRVATDWGLELVVASPAQSATEHEGRLGRLYATDPEACCAMRKVAPAEAALRGHDVWFSAVRRGQASTRSSLDGAILHGLADGLRVVKVHPLVDWSWQDVDQYADSHGVPRHPLYEAGYRSVGCGPCTIPTFGDGDDRSGRWNTTMKTECGLHATGGAVGGEAT